MSGLSVAVGFLLVWSLEAVLWKLNCEKLGPLYSVGDLHRKSSITNREYYKSRIQER